jgi:hypothetical protein
MAPMINLQSATPGGLMRRRTQDGVIATSLTLTNIPDETQRQMLGYWRAKCAIGRLPRRADIDPLDFPWALGVVCLLNVERPPLRFRYRLDGSAIVEHHGRDFTGRTTDELRPTAYADMLHLHFSEVVESAAPNLYRITLLNDCKVRSYVRLALPFATNGSNVDMIMTVSKKGAEPAVAWDPRQCSHPMR